MANLSLSSIPGFADLPDSVLAAGKLSLGSEVAKINSNSAFGMIRLEVFQGVYIDGSTVNLPVSAVDGYNYSREELTYVWALYNTDNQSSGWITGPDSLWYAAWLVDQGSGLVSCEEHYRTSANPPKSNVSNDGQLLVFTIAQRLKTELTISEVPVFKPLTQAQLAQDAAWSQDRAQFLNGNAKFGVVSCEAIYMGEFVTGDTIPAPVSPADGFVYDLSQVTFLPSWRWTCSGARFSQPAVSLGQLGPQQLDIDAATGAVTLNVSYFNSGLTNEPTHGRVSVVALCQRALNRLIVPGTACPWKHTSSLGQPITWNPAYVTDTNYDSQPFSTLPVVLPVALQAGDTITVTAHGTVHYNVGSGYTAGPDGLSPTSRSPDTYITAGNPIFVAGLIGAFTDDFGNVVQVVGIGSSVSLTVPAGATRLQMGIDDSDFIHHSGRFVALVTWTPLTRFPLSSTFVEVDNNDFMPGEVLKASDIAQVTLNCNEAAITPEVFGPVTKGDGDTVSLPVSLIDGYTYSRSELAYFWEWSDTTPTSSGHTMRTAILSGSINASNGVCSVKVYNLVDGGPVTEEGTGFATIRVTVLGMRQQQVSFGSFDLTQVVVTGSTTTYLGDITGGAANEYAGLSFVIAGFSNAGNNVTIKVLSSTGGQLTCVTTTQVNESTSATASNSSTTSAPSDAGTTPADLPSEGSDQINGV